MNFINNSKFSHSIKKENIPIITEKKYRNSFVFSEGFTGKRFKRYIEKVKNFIFNEYISIVYEEIVKETNIDNLVDFIIIFFQNFYLGEWEDEEINGTLFESIHNYAYPMIPSDYEKKVLTNYLGLPHYNSNLSFENIVNTEIEKVCKDFIRFRCSEMDNIDESNYFLTLPEDIIYAILLFDQIINYIKVDVDNICFSSDSKELRKILKQKTVKVLRDSNEEFSNRIEELEKELAENKRTIEILNNRIKSKSTEKNNNTELIKEQNSALIRQNDKIKEKYNQLLHKYEELKVKTSEIIIDSEILKEEMKELDINGKYLFICYEDVTFKRVILDEFPNSDFCDSNININASSVDLVIVLTEHINHSTYYAMKEQCKSKNIPLVHCRFSNLELIKELMWNTLNL